MYEKARHEPPTMSVIIGIHRWHSGEAKRRREEISRWFDMRIAEKRTMFRSISPHRKRGPIEGSKIGKV
jgi:arginase family enzyme